MKKLGLLKRIMNLIPGMGRVAAMMPDADGDPEHDLKQIEGIIDAMTREEREYPEVIDKRPPPHRRRQRNRSGRRQQVAQGVFGNDGNDGADGWHE